jgi:cation-transporting ATPase 13A3/4/5
MFLKGSPEKVKELSDPKSIPKDFHDVLVAYTSLGYRVLGLGVKEIKASYEDIQQKRRDYFENNLTFVGLLIMENKLKPETSPVIQQLNECLVKSIMITGDNALTAISVARKCGIVGHDQKVFLGEVVENQPDVVAW